MKVYLFCFLPFCCCSVARSCLFPTPWTGAHQAPLSSTVSPNLLKFMCIESVMLSNHLILSPLLMPSVFPSIRVFSNESALHITWSKYWSFSFSNSPSNEYSELISLRVNWLDLLAVQGNLKSLCFCLSVKLLISLSNPNESLARQSVLGCRLFSFITLYHAILFWPIEFLLESQLLV